MLDNRASPPPFVLPILEHSNVQAAAAIFTLVNNNQLSRNKPALGWLNPFLYGIGSSKFIDIDMGNNPGCDTDGFSCTRGWDPVRPATPLSLSSRFRLR